MATIEQGYLTLLTQMGTSMLRHNHVCRITVAVASLVVGVASSHADVGADGLAGVLAAVESNLAKTENLAARIHVDSYVGRIENMRPVDDAPKLHRYRYEFDFRMIGESFRFESSTWRDGQPQDRPGLTEVSGYDARLGRQTSYGMTADMLAQGVAHARISPLQHEGAFPKVDQFGKFFSGKQLESHRFYLPFLLQRRDLATLESNGGDGLLHVNLARHATGDYVDAGSTKYTFDPSKNFLLMKVEDSYRIGKAHMEHVVCVDEAVKVDEEIWAPRKLTDVGVMHGVHAPGTGGVYRVTVENIRVGALQPADLNVELPETVRFVDDKLSRVQFQVAPDGRRHSFSAVGLDAGGGSSPDGPTER